jgi:hypothetical protein
VSSPSPSPPPSAPVVTEVATSPPEAGPPGTGGPLRFTETEHACEPLHHLGSPPPAFSQSRVSAISGTRPRDSGPAALGTSSWMRRLSLSQNRAARVMAPAVGASSTQEPTTMAGPSDGTMSPGPGCSGRDDRKAFGSGRSSDG